MSHFECVTIMSAETKAGLFADIVVRQPDLLGTRMVDNLFEMGDGEEVVRAFVNRYVRDLQLQSRVMENSRFINIKDWLEIAKTESKEIKGVS